MSALLRSGDSLDIRQQIVGEVAVNVASGPVDLIKFQSPPGGGGCSQRVASQS